MNNLTDAQLIDDILGRFNIHNISNILQECLKAGEMDNKRVRNTITLLEDEGAVVMHNKDLHKLTSVGREILKQGGWNSYQNNKLAVQKEEENLRLLHLKKLEYETMILKWQAKTFWFFFILAIIGGICGVVSLLIQVI